MTKPKNKTMAVTAFLALVGIVSVAVTNINWYISLPLVLFYGMIVLNTYFSMRLFTHIAPSQKALHHIVDGLLVALFVLLALTFARPILFAFVVTVLFALAAIKYTLMLNDIPHPRLLKRKIVIDLLGKLMGLITLGGMLAGYTLISSWFLAITFTVANISLLFVWPMYRADQ